MGAAMTETSTISWPWQMCAGEAPPELRWFGERFGFLQRALAQGQFRRDAAIVPVAGARSKLASVEIDGGRDVKYVIVYARELPASSRPGIRESVTYRRDVAGTDVIYDLTGEFLQGKARPFACDLRTLPLRVFAVLPFQVERLKMSAQQRAVARPRSERQHEGRIAHLKLRVQFLDGADEPMEGRFPIGLGLRRRDDEVSCGRYTTTDNLEPFTLAFPVASADRDLRVVVRSLMTGDELTLPIELIDDGEVPADVPWTQDGLHIRRAPQPVR